MRLSRTALRLFAPAYAIAAVALLEGSAHGQIWAGPGGPGPGIGTIQSSPLPNGTKLHMPWKLPVSRKTGLELFIDSRWANGYGYRPFEVTVNSPAPATSDHLISIQLHSGSA